MPIYMVILLDIQRVKENITGYQYEPWHLRYVGVDIATYIYNHKIF